MSWHIALFLKLILLARHNPIAPRSLGRAGPSLAWATHNGMRMISFEGLSYEGKLFELRLSSPSLPSVFQRSVFQVRKAELKGKEAPRRAACLHRPNIASHRLLSALTPSRPVIRRYTQRALEQRKTLTHKLHKIGNGPSFN